MNATTLQLGPLTLPWSLLALLLGVWLGTWWHERWALRRHTLPDAVILELELPDHGTLTRFIALR